MDYYLACTDAGGVKECAAPGACYIQADDIRYNSADINHSASTICVYTGKLGAKQNTPCPGKGGVTSSV
jgi:uncharacterized protein (DUF427 family)